MSISLRRVLFLGDGGGGVVCASLERCPASRADCLVGYGSKLS